MSIIFNKSPLFCMTFALICADFCRNCGVSYYFITICMTYIMFVYTVLYVF